MINDIKKDAQERMSKSLEALGRNLASIRTGRAHPSILDSIKVPAWGSDRSRSCRNSSPKGRTADTSGLSFPSAAWAKSAWASKSTRRFSPSRR